MPNCTVCGTTTEWEGDEPPLCQRCWDVKVELDDADARNAASKASRERRKQSVAAYQAGYYRSHRGKGVQG